MGNCVSPETDESSFAVWNVDDGGNRVQPGRISLTETHLVFVQKGGEPIRWPLSGLRRYGFDAELFSFESGRRCPTGSGVYAFKCPRAERLFNLLQERIQAQAPIRPNSLVDSPPSPQEMRTTADYLEPISLGAQVVSTVNFVNNVSPAVTATTTAAAGPGPVYQNVPVQNQQQQHQQPLQQPQQQQIPPQIQQPQQNQQAQQQQQVPPLAVPVPTTNSATSNCNKRVVASLDSLTAPGVNYVVLDLDQPSEPPTPTSPTSPTPATIAPSQSPSPPAPLGYAQIDFDKTMALQQIASRSRTSDS